MLQEEIQEAIKKNLPQQVGESLQKRLKDLEDKEKEFSLLKVQNSDLQNSYNSLKKESSQKDDNLIILNKITEKTKDLDNRENKLQIEILTIRLEESNKRSEICKDLVQTVFRNPTFKTIEQSWGTRSVDDFYSINGCLNKQNRTEPDNKRTEISTEQTD